MTTFLLIVIFLLIWFGASVYWVFLNIGNKWRKNYWYDVFLAAPVLGVLWVVDKFRR